MMKTKTVIALLVLFLSIVTAHAEVTFDWATVGNPGNGPDDTGFGAVSYVYRISKHEVTNAQYTEFLNAADPAGANARALYNSNMSSSGNGGINFNSGAANGFKYQLKSGRDNNPVVFVSFFDAMRFTNWLQNGQGSGSTESGVYTIGNGVNEIRNPGATYFIPSENEWYKAAYHKNNGVTGGATNYFNYPTSTDAIPFSDQPPGSGAPTQSNTANSRSDDGIANGYNDGHAVTGSPNFSSSQNYLTDVGAYTASLSPYDTFDQGGNVWEWNEAVIDSSDRVFRGSGWNYPPAGMAASERHHNPDPTWGGYHGGFRVASIPEPSVNGDFDNNGVLDVADIDDLTVQSASGLNSPGYDLNSDAFVNEADVNVWVKGLFHSWIGDANLDKEFSSDDFVQAFSAGKYEAQQAAVWSAGDWNGDGLFTSDDFITAFQDGGYEQGPRTDAAAVPEPGGLLLLILGLVGVMRRRRTA